MAVEVDETRWRATAAPAGLWIKDAQRSACEHHFKTSILNNQCLYGFIKFIVCVCLLS